MKKIILTLFLTLLIAGCSTGDQVEFNEQNAPPGTGNYDLAGLLNRMNEIRNGAVPKMKPDKKNSSNNQNNMQAQQQNQVNLEPLADQYSQAVLKTNFGDIKVVFYTDESPVTVNNFLNLAKRGFYNGIKFHRVINDFMIQGGDPLSADDSLKSQWGTGGPGYKFQDEINNHKLVKGSLAMANSGPDTNGSQFFIVTAEATPWLDGKHTNFGYVVDGMAIVDKIESAETDERDCPLESIIIESIELLEIAN